VLRFDRRGFGLSSGLPDIHRNVDDLAALLDAVQIQGAGLLGMSQGARLAIHFARRHPSRVRALMLDGAPAIEAETELPLVEYRAQLQAQGEPALQAAVLRHPLMQLHGTSAPARKVLSSTVAHYRGLDLLHPVPRAAAPDLRQINIKTLILNGSRDSAERREAGRLLQESIAGAQRMELAGAGHLAMLDDPQAYADAVIRFYRDLPG
jgi:pimeloyl-ACP methyl ester carboxylesterase